MVMPACGTFHCQGVLPPIAVARAAMNTQAHYALRAAVIGSIAVLSVGLSAQSPVVGTIQVSGARPLELVVTELQRRYGRVITYEDPIRVSSADLKDVTDTIPVDRRQNRRHFIPLGGTFTFSYKPLDDSSDESILATLNMLVQQYNRVSPDAQFRVARSGRVFHVLPSARRGVDGRIEEARSPLDARITIPNGSRTAADQLVAIRDALRRAGYPGIGVGIAPLNALRGTVTGGVLGESARDALVRLLDDSPDKLTWSFLCGAGPEPSCMLNVLPLVRD